MEGDVLLKVLRPLQSPALGLAFDGLCAEHRGFFQHSQVRILAPQPPIFPFILNSPQRNFGLLHLFRSD
jgi:hypothetical protein